MSMNHSAPLKGAEAKRSWRRVLTFAIVTVLLAFAGYGFGLGQEGSFLTEVSSAHTSQAAAESTLSPPSGLVGWWGGEGNADDLAGDNHGILSGDTTFVPGVVGQAFSFDGNNDYITVPHSNELNPGTADFTVSFWMNTTADGPQIRVIFNKFPICTYSSFWVVRLWEGKIRIDLAQSSVSNYTTLYSTMLVNDGNWHHITLVRQNTTATLYIDGQVETSATTTGVLNIANTTPLRIGNEVCVGSSTEFYQGLLDEMQLYNRALSDSEIEALYQLGVSELSVSPTSLTATLTSGESTTETLSISNSSTSELNWNMSTNATWLSAPSSGLVAPNSSQSVTISIDSSGLVGTYTDTLTITSNDPNEPSLEVPITLTVAHVPIDGLVAYWSFDDGTATDNSGNGHDGTIYDNPQVVDGVSGAAFSFDGNNDYVGIPHSNELNPGTADFTVSFWMNTDSTSHRAMLNKRSVCTYSSFWDVRLWSDSKLRLELAQNFSRTTYNSFYSTIPVSDGNWHHITLVRQSTTATLYIDGQVDNSGTTTNVTNIANTVPLLIGNDPCVGYGPEFYQGLLDEILFYNRALSDSEIEALYRHGQLTIRTPGDVSCDGLINMVDFMFIMQHVSGDRSASDDCPSSPESPPTLFRPSCDVNHDNVCDITDGLLIVRCINGYSNELCPASNMRSASHSDLQNASSAPWRIGTAKRSVDGTLTVPIRANLTRQFGATTIDVQYDPNQLQPAGCMADPQQQFDFSLCNPEYKSGTMRLTAISTGGKFSGGEDVLLAELSFQPIGDKPISAIGDLTLNPIILVDAAGQPIPQPVSSGQRRRLYLPLIQK